jgi:2,3-bisphosphoglycerate-dependent phosphoglycerate mutase
LVRADIVLVRHAVPVYPSPGGPDDYHRPLTEAGHAQALALVDDLAALRPDAIASSPYLRAVQTIEPLARALDLPVHTDHDLREWDSGVGPTPDYVRYYEESWADPDFARPGAESLNQLTTRALKALTAFDGTVVIGSHGTFICRVLAGLGLAVDWPFSRDMPSPAVYRISDKGIAGPGI